MFTHLIKNFKNLNYGTITFGTHCVQICFGRESYEAEDFKISFSQSVDFKGQPQHEMLGGQLYVTLTQAADDNLYLWAKKEDRLKSGVILFQTDLGMTVLEMTFTDAYCVHTGKSINAYTGMTTALILSTKKLSMNGVKHENYWKNG